MPPMPGKPGMLKRDFLPFLPFLPFFVGRPAFAAAGIILHHLARFVELLHDLIHFLNRSARAGRDALAAAAIEQLGLFALGLRHREDDGLHAIERARINLTLRHGLIATGSALMSFEMPPILETCFLIWEVVQVNVGPLNALGGLGLNLRPEFSTHAR